MLSETTPDNLVVYVTLEQTFPFLSPTSNTSHSPSSAKIGHLNTLDGEIKITPFDTWKMKWVKKKVMADQYFGILYIFSIEWLQKGSPSSQLFYFF